MTIPNIPGQTVPPPTRWTADYGVGTPIQPMPMPDPALLPKPLATLITRYTELAAAATAATKEADDLARNRQSILTEWQRERAAALAAGRKPTGGDQPLDKLNRRIQELVADHQAHIAAGEMLLTEIAKVAVPLAAGEAARLAAEQAARARRTREAIDDATAAADDLADHDRLVEWWKAIDENPQRAPRWSGFSVLQGRLVRGYLHPAAQVVDQVIADLEPKPDPDPDPEAEAEPVAGDQEPGQEPGDG